MSPAASALGAALLAAGTACAAFAVARVLADPCAAAPPSLPGTPDAGRWRSVVRRLQLPWQNAVSGPDSGGRPGLLLPLADLCREAGVPVPPAWALGAGLILAALAVHVLAPLRNLPLLALVGCLAAAAPVAALRMRAQARRAALRRLVGPALGQLARLVRVRRHPYLALVDLVPGLPQPLRRAMEDALASYRGGLPLPDALREAARALGDDPYLNQLAELVNLSLVQGSDLAASLDRLVERYRAVQELQAEEQIQSAGYRRLAWVLFLGSQLPVVWYALSGSPSLTYLTEHPLLRLFVFWNAVSGLCVVLLPQLLSPEAI